MPRATNKLTVRQIEAAKPTDRPLKLSDGGGMFLLVQPDGARWWRLSYRYGGKQRTISLGTYPDTSLKTAREGRDAAKALLAQGTDPSVERRIRKAALAEDSFEAVAREWHGRQLRAWTPGYAEITMARIEGNLVPWLGSRPIGAITAPELLACLRRIEARGAHDLARRCRQLAGQVFRYAISIGKAERDPSQDLRGALTAPSLTHRAAITRPNEIGRLLRDIDAYQGTLVVRAALRMGAYLFVRPGELRHAEWDELDMEAGLWRIPAAKMKMRDPHLVPLAPQVVAILDELRPLTYGRGKYLLPSMRSADRPMSENTILAALRALGYSKEEMTGHGFRSMASTRLNEMGWPPDVIERQLAHRERNAVRAAYNHAEHLPERRRMMAAWADYLDGLKNGADVVGLRRARTA